MRTDSVLFLCVANSARSQLAEALARHRFGDRLRVQSAGSQPSQVNPWALRVLAEAGVPTEGLRSKNVQEIAPESVGLVITLCAEESCPVFLGAAPRLTWEMPDPAGEGDDEAQLARFRAARDHLAPRIEGLARTLPASPAARDALAQVEGLQARLIGALRGVATARGDLSPVRPACWLRDGGRHGGGERLGYADSPTFQRASVNVSIVHYDDEPDRRLASATALSAIVHPAHPRAPSMHLHVSWTETRGAPGVWRVMVDLNPSIPREPDRERFVGALRAAAPEVAEAALRQGDRYFYIPSLERHRGVAHFYLESWRTDSPAEDAALAQRVAEVAIDTYAQLVADALIDAGPPTEAEVEAQLAYHTLYFFQVLTLDRGTTSGLLIHDQNDVGVLGSLPARVDRGLLATWRARVPSPQERLVDALLAALPEGEVVTVDEAAKARLAAAVRAHYRAHPEALALQAAGDLVPPTVANHGAP